MYKKSRITTLTLLVTMLALALISGYPRQSSAKNQTQNMLLVELFTSQGCSSCPPADEYFSELAEKKNLAVLAWHVPYWDYIGWKDPFSTKEAENRQRKYARKLRTGQVYTPQAVIAAKKQFVGSDRRAVGKSLRDEMRRSNDDKNTPKLSLQREDDGDQRAFYIKIEQGNHAIKNGEKPKFNLSLVAFQSFAETDIERGENRGKLLREANIVRTVKNLGSWDGGVAKKFSFRLPKQSADFDVLRDGGIVVIAEPENSGGASAATRWDFKRGFKPQQS